MPDLAAVLAAYLEGVDAIEGATHGIDAAGRWATPACGTWSALDVAAHVGCVAGWYHAWLDQGLAGDAAPQFGMADLDGRNAAALAVAPPVDGPERVKRFVESARDHAERVAATPDVAIGFPGGVAPARMHAGIAAIEWHVHAWDLWQAAGGPPHRPSRPDVLLAAAAQAMAVARAPRPLAPVARVVAPRLARLRGEPWRVLLRNLGRR